MATTNFRVDGTSPQTAAVVSGLTDGHDYEIQNRVAGEIYALTSTVQPDGTITPKQIGRGGSFYIRTTGPGSVYVWRKASVPAGDLVIEDLGESP